MSQTLLQELSCKDIDWLMATGRRQKVDADRLLIKAGKQIATFYLLIDGSLTILVSQSSDNALNRAFAALEDKSTLERDIIELKSGDVAGEELLVSTRAASTNIRTKLPSEVLMIPQHQLQAKLQQDLGWAARFEEVVATLAAERFRDTINRLGYGRNFYSSSQALEQSFSYEDELNLDSLDKLNLGRC